MTLSLANRLILLAPFALWVTAPASASILGSADNFAVLGASAVTNTVRHHHKRGSRSISRNFHHRFGNHNPDGDGPPNGRRCTASPGGLSAAFNFLAAQPFTMDLTGTDLGGLVLGPGVYNFDKSAQLTGALTLDAMGQSNALFIFQIGSTLTTASASAVNVINGGTTTGVFWDIGSSATLGTSTAFAGNLIADQSITLNTTATILCGRAIALNGAVTLDTNTISNDCSTLSGGRTDFGSMGFGGNPSTVVPEPATFMLAGLALLSLGAKRSFPKGRA